MMLAARGLIDESVHPAQVAGSFYPVDPAELRNRIDQLMSAEKGGGLQGKAVVMPHAGLDFSGSVAAAAAQALDTQNHCQKVVIIGPSHRANFKGIVLHPARAWSTPLGEVPVDWVGMRELLPAEDVSIDRRPFIGEHSIEMPLLFLQRLFAQFQVIPILVGAMTAEAMAENLRKVWGGPDTLICLSSDLSHFLSRDNARALDRETRALLEQNSWRSLTPRRACGHHILSGAIKLSESLRMRVTGLDFATSDEVGGSVDRVVGYGAFVFQYPGVSILQKCDRELLLDLASAAIGAACEQGGRVPRIVADGNLSSALGAQRATFVTLEKHGNLRGCMGSVRSVRTLAGDVATNVLRAGFSDPRFPPLSHDDLPGLTIKISILSPIAPIDCRSEEELVHGLRPDRDGLILQDGGKGALFLPSVWRAIADPAQFVRALKAKADLAADYWSSTLQSFRFGVETFEAPYRGPQSTRLGPITIG
jgi:AmmeMemoRadiSam system protein B/AmmeMemoRadiSam system protein A